MNDQLVTKVHGKECMIPSRTGFTNKSKHDPDHFSLERKNENTDKKMLLLI